MNTILANMLIGFLFSGFGVVVWELGLKIFLDVLKEYEKYFKRKD